MSGNWPEIEHHLYLAQVGHRATFDERSIGFVEDLLADNEQLTDDMLSMVPKADYDETERALGSIPRVFAATISDPRALAALTAGTEDEKHDLLFALVAVDPLLALLRAAHAEAVRAAREAAHNKLLRAQDRDRVAAHYMKRTREQLIEALLNDSPDEARAVLRATLSKQSKTELVALLALHLTPEP